MRLIRVGTNESLLEIDKIKSHEVLFSWDTPVAARIGDAFFMTDSPASKASVTHINKYLGTAKKAAFIKDQEFFNSLVEVADTGYFG